MPIYEYHCLACGEAFEKLVFGQAPVACPGCASADVARTLSVFGVKSAPGAVGGSRGGSGGGGGCGCR